MVSEHCTSCIKIFVLFLFTIFFYCCSGSQKERDKQNSAFVGTTQRTEKKVEPQGSSVVMAVRTGNHPQYDRIVFEFDSTIPSYRVEYIARPYHQCGSGEEVTLGGVEILEVSFSVAQAHDEAGHATLGKLSVPPSSQMEEIRIVCDFEGEVTFLIGMKGKIPYRVSGMKNPERLVLDIQRR
jgi:hypothetical protein